MIVEPRNDVQCLAQLTRIARELAPTTLVDAMAARLGTVEAVVTWLRSLPQTNDRGEETVRYIVCDVPQRVRLFPDDPNCVERAVAALMLLESVAPQVERSLATIDRPERHTGVVEKIDGRWRALDVFPRRNAGSFNWTNFGKDVVQGAHRYVGKPILKFYLGETGGKVADTIGEQQDKALGRYQPKDARKKEPSPPTQRSRRSDTAAGADGFDRKQEGESSNGKEEGPEDSSGTQRRDGAGARASGSEASEGDGDHSHDAREEAQRWWWSLRGWR